MDDATRDWIDEVLDGATCLGVELDTTYRVLAATLEPRADRHPEPGADDTRVQLVLHPCSEVAARLLHDGSTVEQFGVTQLLAVVEALDAPTLRAPIVTADAPPLTGELSLEGAANATVRDGRTHVAQFELAGADRTLVLRVTYDEAELRRPDGSVLTR